MDLGKPIKKYVVVPLDAPVSAPEPVQRPVPAPTPKSPIPAEPDLVPTK